VCQGPRRHQNAAHTFSTAGVQDRFRVGAVVPSEDIAASQIRKARRQLLADRLRKDKGCVTRRNVRSGIRRCLDDSAPDLGFAA
jgi:hypothetical protein